MERTFRREKKLDEFVLDSSDFESLWVKLSAQFDNPDDMSASFEIKLQGETLKFRSIEEIEQCLELPDIIAQYSLTLIQDNRYVSLKSEDSLDVRERAVIRVAADDVGWCAGVIETAVLFLRKYRVWYRWIYSSIAKFILAVTVAIVCVPGAIYELLETGETKMQAILISVLLPVSSMSTYWFLGFLTKRLLPANAIRTSEKESFLRRRGTELVLIFTVIGVVIAAISLLYTIINVSP